VPFARKQQKGNVICVTIQKHYHNTEMLVGFIHVPFLPKQAKQNAPSVP
jgi:pyrrolidone-carboxylate peptidase